MLHSVRASADYSLAQLCETIFKYSVCRQKNREKESCFDANIRVNTKQVKQEKRHNRSDSLPLYTHNLASLRALWKSTNVFGSL